jgi:hypothetical protein
MISAKTIANRWLKSAAISNRWLVYIGNQTRPVAVGFSQIDKVAPNWFKS